MTSLMLLPVAAVINLPMTAVMTITKTKISGSFFLNYKEQTLTQNAFTR